MIAPHARAEGDGHPVAVARACTGDFRPGPEVVHDHSGLAFYVRGETRMRMGVEYVLRPGDVLLVPEGMPHGGGEHGHGEAELVGITVCTACLRGGWGDVLRRLFDDVRHGAVASRRLSDETFAEVLACIERLRVELRDHAAQRELMIDGLMSEITAHVARAAPSNTGPTDLGWPTVVADALGFVERHAHEGISLRDVARAVGRSSTHLAALVKRHTGRTVVAWITHARMALARQLLAGSDEGIEAVASRVGFASPSHFHRAFRRLHGVSPGEWRATHRGR
ncbi:MAG: helix-turn-helix transcriptional regulator [Sandaracinus sp.]|nr:helix-turn-helix transcriptional regulator [Sandaracinus sp.]MCB9620788.1 helix-turn-helix transcriptional regulator [Sandaracinus sp.]MCB9623755.1 helix-turn-helix transcriptional regulator [Sandaracinus sp.]MCB9630916.1 helix-turn-helix transcriptional regulator [Sandaracinus sp.]